MPLVNIVTPSIQVPRQLMLLQNHCIRKSAKFKRRILETKMLFLQSLDMHFNNAAKCYHFIGRMDDTNIKQAYLKSLSQTLGQETSRMIEIKRQSLEITSFGELYNQLKRTLKKLYNQREFLKNINTIGQKLEKACDHPNLKINCRHDNRNYDCSGKKKYHKLKFKFRNKKLSKAFP